MRVPSEDQNGAKTSVADLVICVDMPEARLRVKTCLTRSISATYTTDFPSGDHEGEFSLAGSATNGANRWDVASRAPDPSKVERAVSARAPKVTARTAAAVRARNRQRRTAPARAEACPELVLSAITVSSSSRRTSPMSRRRPFESWRDSARAIGAPSSASMSREPTSSVLC